MLLFGIFDCIEKNVNMLSILIRLESSFCFAFFFYLSLGTQDKGQGQKSPRKHQHGYDRSVKFKKKDGNVYVAASVPLVNRSAPT